MPTAARLAFLAEEYREAVDTDASVQTAHLLSPQIIQESTLTVEANAQAEATRRLALRKVQRNRYEFKVPMIDETELIDLGDIIDLTHTRFGLTGTKKVVVLGVEPNAKSKRITLNVWG